MMDLRLFSGTKLRAKLDTIKNKEVFYLDIVEEDCHFILQSMKFIMDCLMIKIKNLNFILID